MLDIRETTKEDLRNTQLLWADGDVMKYVGFPDGIHETDASMEKWYEWIVLSRPVINHYSIYFGGNYCGETFYQIDAERKSAAMDIKLYPHARGQGVASIALKFAIGEAFRNGAQRVWVNRSAACRNPAIRIFS